ncbi:MAG: ATP-binding cassette domain-containing protein [Phycisphaerae bacterium]|nr:MAG: ABC transporter ATP-binding protein [Planctomycetota bacterium]KAB2946856.1 MAG: ABC-F family ATP-binding cassette domain-containing protein [Phycisphaerae bacterium]MBE7457051.1 ABC-F family ATP-binding cassette domain-containing protein [Planctomycetia bacterium]MCK6463591.1 ABC-F family ATP-binding cassette domain-containing protein [Phycisphaerae bacterium]MCL4718259.1 ATP-binding cassette domain-containing protein [Phycisphaerae bacterium]
MSAISLKNVMRQFGGDVVINDLSLDLRAGEIVGLVGANGAGKTTLFRLITGELEPDKGTVTRSRGLRLGYLSQEPVVRQERTLHDEVASAFGEILDIEYRIHDISERVARLSAGAEQDDLLSQLDRLQARFEAAGGYTMEARMGEILGGLGFSAADRDLPVSALSGGQKCRAALARLLLEEPEFLLLDEPTNHLDIDAVRWLEKYLAAHHGGVVIISHDRYLLDRLAERIVEVAGGKASSYPGNYSNYVHVRDLRRLTQERQYEQDRAFIEKERDFIARHLAGQRTKEAQGRRTRLERKIADGELVLERPQQRRGVRLRFNVEGGLKGEILRAESLRKSYGERKLFSGLDLQLHAGQRLAITGPNGTGKSTLLKILLGEVAADEGTVRWDRAATLGYYAQESTSLDPQSTVLEEIRRDRPELSETQARSILGAFLFTGDDAFKPLGKLSGGEQSRVRLIRLILSQPDVLILDEPTNHLDIASREALEEALIDFPGTIVAVSHDRYFLDRIAQRLLVMRPEGHRFFTGNYSDYIETLEREQESARAATESARPAASGTAGAREGKAIASGARKLDVASAEAAEDPLAQERAEYDRYSIDEIEVFIYEQEQEIARLNEVFADPATYRDPEKIADLQDQLDDARHKLAVLQSAWDERAEYQ